VGSPLKLRSNRVIDLSMHFLVNSTEQSTFGGRSPTNGAQSHRLMVLTASSSGIQSHSFLDCAEISFFFISSYSSLHV